MAIIKSLSIGVGTNLAPLRKDLSQARTEVKSFGASTPTIAGGFAAGIGIAKAIDSGISAVKNTAGDDGLQWEVTVNYGSSQADSNPLHRPWEYSVSYEQHQVPVDFDIHGKPILNKANDFSAEYVMADDARPVLTGTKAFASFPFDVANNYCNTVNRDTVFGCNPKTLKFERISGQQNETKVNGNTLIYFDVTLELSYNRNGFVTKLLNQGYRQKKNGKLVPIQLNGKDAQQPVLLDNQGRRLPESGVPVTLQFELYPSRPFAPLFF